MGAVITVVPPDAPAAVLAVVLVAVPTDDSLAIDADPWVDVVLTRPTVDVT